MAEAIHCPSCSTRYRLRSERLRPAIRRAKCFSCGSVFPVGDVVARLLAPPASAEELEPLHSLHLGDLEDEPETEAPLPPPAFPPEITETTLSGYTSARDAIDKLFGDAPVSSPGLKASPDPSSMDMEATLSALEATLGGVPATPSPEAPQPAGTDPAWAGDGPTESSRISPRIGRDAQAASSTTVRLSQEDLQAILDSAPQASAPAPSQPVVRAAAPVAAADSGGELLRLKIGEEIYPGLTMGQLTAWVEEGRILEGHLVARQHSENWLEAHKVPGLRPVFDRLRRERSGGSATLSSPVLDIAPKKSLFGGLFGKN
ncbi:zinc-ribbon domain-containing protein [Geothrix sp. 21YS21S-4]|uniref:zinc-ribbon domain-containing protein n=1 Tax=Geothrix sp. 21YS21S-4 TaxID=3068889 RepID=UPI0027B92027|nr:zinc-ribbon domain-containing protein [Geothrix sp. 21YS21S-4]